MKKIELGPSAEVVVDTAERVPQHGGIGVTLTGPYCDIPEDQWHEWIQAGGANVFTFPSLKEADAVLYEAVKLLGSGSTDEAIKLVHESTILSYHQKSEPARWAHMTVQMPGDWGPQENDRQHMRKTLTSKSSGVVLEAMCGFTSYIDDKPDISEVLAMDFCREGLERYDRPERRRILFDLDSLDGTTTMEFLPSESVDTIAITFGLDYLCNITTILEDFMRVLSRGGNLLVVGGTGCGYSDLRKRRFSPGFYASLMQGAGFDTWVTELDYDNGVYADDVGYALIEATKP